MHGQHDAFGGEDNALMARILDCEPHIILLRKAQSGNDVTGSRYIDGVAGIIAQLAGGGMVREWNAGLVLEPR
jgi:hypothetical protein